jgi:GxxExxY protein
MKRLARSVVYRFAVFDFFVFSYFRAFVICSDETPMRHDFAPLSARIIEAAIAVHRALGPGFLESIYHGALRVALSQFDIPYENKKEVRVYFEGVEVGVHQLDLLVDEQIIVELKAVKALEDVHFAQVRSYLKATGLRIGLLINFNASTLAVKRIVLG